MLRKEQILGQLANKKNIWAEKYADKQGHKVRITFILRKSRKEPKGGVEIEKSTYLEEYPMEEPQDEFFYFSSLDDALEYLENKEDITINLLKKKLH